MYVLKWSHLLGFGIDFDEILSLVKNNFVIHSFFLFNREFYSCFLKTMKLKNDEKMKLQKCKHFVCSILKIAMLRKKIDRYLFRQQMLNYIVASN